MNAIVEGIVQAITGAAIGQEARRRTGTKKTSRALVLPAVDSKQEPSALALMFVLFAGFLGVANTGHAVTTTALQDTTCAADRQGNNLLCTASEFAVLDIFEIVSPSPVTCLAGEHVTVDVRFRLSNSNTDRYDIGFFVGQEGNSPSLTSPPPSLGLDCSVATFPTSPFPWQDYDGDACGDYAARGVDEPVVQNIKILCVGDPDTGLVEVPYTLTYWENRQFTCNGPENVTAGTRSKCADGTAIVVTGTEPLVVYGSVTVTKQTEPDLDPDSFSFTANGDVTTCPGSPTPETCPGKIAPGDESFSLSDGQSKEVKMVVGSTNHVLTITEDYNPGWESTADITCSGGVSVTTDGATRTIWATLNTTSPHATCTITNTAQRDYGDAPDSYGTTLSNNGARHLPTPGLQLGAAIDQEADGQPGSPGGDAIGDDSNPVGGQDDEDGVADFGTTAGPGFQITATVRGTLGASLADAMLCGYLDGAANGSVDGQFSRNVDYVRGVGLDGAIAGLGNEEVCIKVTTSLDGLNLPPVSGFNGASARCIGAALPDGSFRCTFVFNPNFTTPLTTYARFRLTRDPAFFSNASPSPTGAADSGEAEDYRILVNPTAVTIGSVDLKAQAVTGFLNDLDAGGMTDAELLALLAAWDPEAAEALAGADREAILAALRRYLDPDGDGQVAVLRWDTLEQRGTVGFYVDRRGGGGDWQRINGDMLPALIGAPLGGEYRLADPAARAGVPYEYLLIEQEAWGSTRSYGPFSLELAP